MTIAPILVALIGIAGCIQPQPESARTVAAYEVPLPSQSDRDQFLEVLSSVAEVEGMRVVAVSKEDLKRISKAGPLFEQALNATVLKGANDDETIASAMDLPDNLGKVWILFSKGEDVMQNKRFREAAVREIMRNWPATLSLPILPSGGIPLSRDLIRTPEGYVVNPAEAHKYELHSGNGVSG